jgi:hypothetical protein
MLLTVALGNFQTTPSRVSSFHRHKTDINVFCYVLTSFAIVLHPIGSAAAAATSQLAPHVICPGPRPSCERLSRSQPGSTCSCS